MPTTKKIARRQNNLGRKNYKGPPPLRFKSVPDASKHIKANKLKVTEIMRHTRGARIQVVDPEGKARTISIEPEQITEKEE